MPLPTVCKMDIRVLLKEHVVPGLRSRGFAGSFPHFRRVVDPSIYLITFQLDKWGSGNFVVELAKAPCGSFSMRWGEHVPASKLTAHHVDKRFRLGSASSNDDHWFQYQDFAANAGKASAKMLALLDTQGTRWWAGA